MPIKQKLTPPVFTVSNFFFFLQVNIFSASAMNFPPTRTKPFISISTLETKTH